VDRKRYILEATGCGCALVDDDNDAWVDIFRVPDRRFRGVKTWS